MICPYEFSNFIFPVKGDSGNLAGKYYFQLIMIVLLTCGILQNICLASQLVMLLHTSKDQSENCQVKIKALLPQWANSLWSIFLSKSHMVTNDKCVKPGEHKTSVLCLLLVKERKLTETSQTSQVLIQSASCVRI